jgi:hypothetical protein
LLVEFTDIYRQITMKMTTRTLVSGFALGGATLAMAFGSIDRAQAAVLFTENFGSGIGDQYGVTSGTIGGFTVTGGNVDLIGNGGAYDFFPGNGHYLDLNGDTAGTVTTTSSFTFNPGESGTLSFDYGSHNAVSADVSIFFGGSQIGTLTAANSSSFSPYTVSFSNPGSGTLSFVSNSGGFDGVIIDNIQLSSNTAAVPEPADLMGTAVAFGSVVLLKRNLSKKRNAAK